MNYILPKKPNKLITKGGWDIIHIYGSPYERGYAHGYLLAGKFAHIQKVFEYEVTTEFKVSLAEYLRTCRENVSPIVKNKYPEFYEELRGIADGVNAKTTIHGKTMKEHALLIPIEFITMECWVRKALINILKQENLDYLFQKANAKEDLVKKVTAIQQSSSKYKEKML
jgi:hypothetical protein